MEDGVSEEVTPLDAAEGASLQNKVRLEAQPENECILKPEMSTMLETQEMLIPGESDFSQGYPPEFADIIEGKNLSRIRSHGASEQPYSSPRYMDEAGVMVEELTVKNYDGSNLAIVGTSNHRERVFTWQNKWHLIYQLPSGSGSGNSPGEAAYVGTGQSMSTGLEGTGTVSFPENFGRKRIRDDCGDALEELSHTESREASGNIQGGFRSKILSKSGFSEYFVKNTLKGKGTIKRGPPREGFHLEPKEHIDSMRAGGSTTASDALPHPDIKTAMPSLNRICEPNPCDFAVDGTNLRQWINAGRDKVHKRESMNIFRQIVELVDRSHSQGVALSDLRPSSFRLLTSKQVRYSGSYIRPDLQDNVMGEVFPHSEDSLMRKRVSDQGTPSSSLKKQKFIRNFSQRPSFLARSSLKLETGNVRSSNVTSQQASRSELGQHQANAVYGSWSESSFPFWTSSSQLPANEMLEEKWYSSPEDLKEGRCTRYSNIYSLGVLLFELLGHFDSDGAHALAMSNLHHRILPPNFLAENPREAGFCLWLLYPEPGSRPTAREILESEVIGGMPEASAEELSSIEQDDADSELLLQFLTTLREEKQKFADTLVEDIRCLEADMDDIERRNSSSRSSICSYLHAEPLIEKGKMLFQNGPLNYDVLSQISSFSIFDESRLKRNIDQLESAYFSMRSRVQIPENDDTVRMDIELLRTRESWNALLKDEEKKNSTDRLGAFFDGFCKYSRYSKFEVRGMVANGDFSSSSNVICSLSFDRDEDYFAAAGVSKKIKIFEFNALFNASVDIHYPVVEMVNRSKLSCICWNSYIKNFLASTDYDGVVKLWDACTGQETSQYTEHDRRAWSVDFSPVYPTKLASGSDDCSVKLWSINDKTCLGTIRNIANVCCVQFSAHSTHLLAFGSADYRTYCYDIRHTKSPWCVLGGHEKAVSYVKFLDSRTLVSASTDNSLKLWDLNKTNPSGLSTNACSSTLSGHTNEKNFVGLSVSDGYIACGSETNEVYTYYRSLPMPITSHKFGSVDAFSGKATDDDNGQFVSSVCWRGKSDMLVAANSSGCIKVLQLV